MPKTQAQFTEVADLVQEFLRKRRKRSLVLAWISLAISTLTVAFVSKVPMEGSRAPFLVLVTVILILPSIVWLLILLCKPANKHRFIRALMSGEQFQTKLSYVSYGGNTAHHIRVKLASKNLDAAIILPLQYEEIFRQLL